MSTKHVREAIKKAGLKRSDVTVTMSGGHYQLQLKGSKRRITTSSSPSDQTITTLKLARDLTEVKNQLAGAQ